MLEDWPQPGTSGGVELEVGDFRDLVVRYDTEQDRGQVTVRFKTCYYMTFGSPNDEALHKHRLWGHGLRHYTVHRIENSSLIPMVDRQSAGPRGATHYLFAFKESTLECVVKSGGPE